MKIYFHVIVAVFFLQSCSSTTPINNWQFQAASSLNSYTKYFLEGDMARAKTKLHHAREEASKSINLFTLINIELSVCANEISVLKSTSCQKASELLLLDTEPMQLAYLSLLRRQVSAGMIQDLPSQYKDFALALLHKDNKKLNSIVSHIQPLSSRLLASALIKERLTASNRKVLIEEISYNGYKTALLAWLEFDIRKEDNVNNKQRLEKKLKILISH